MNRIHAIMIFCRRSMAPCGVLKAGPGPRVETAGTGSAAPSASRRRRGHVKRIFAKPYAGTPHVRIERGMGKRARTGTAPPDYQWISVTWSISLRAARPRASPPPPARSISSSRRCHALSPAWSRISGHRSSTHCNPDSPDRAGGCAAGGRPADHRRGPGRPGRSRRRLRPGPRHCHAGKHRAHGRIDLACVLADIREHHPGVVVKLRQSKAGSEGLVHAVRDGTVDIAMTATPDEPPRGIVLHPLFSEPMVFVCLPDHRQSQRPSVAVPDLREEMILRPPPVWETRTVIDAALGATPPRLRSSLRADVQVGPRRVRDDPGTGVSHRRRHARRPVCRSRR